MREGRASVVRRIDEDALHLASKLLLQRLEREQVVAKDEPVVEDVLLADTLLGVLALLRVFKQDARLQPRPVLLANPGQFQSLLALRHFEIVLAFCSESVYSDFGVPCR